MADIYNIGEFLGIAQHRDGSLLNTGTAIDARNMDTSDGNLSVAKGYVRKSGNAIPSSAGQILRIIPVDESNILAVTQNSIYHGTYDTWNLTPIYTFETTLPVTCQLGYALGKINTTNVVVIGTGKTQLIKVNMGDTVTAEIFGSGLYIFETTVASYTDKVVTLADAMSQDIQQKFVVEKGVYINGVFRKGSITSDTTITLDTTPGVAPVAGNTVKLRGGASDAHCNFVCMHNGRLFAAGDPDAPNRLYWSTIPGDGRTIEHWLAIESSVDLSGGYVEVGDTTADPIIGICELSTQILIFKRYSIYRLYGDRPSYYTVERVEKFTENMSNAGVAVKTDIPYWLTKSGIKLFNGADMQLLDGGKHNLGRGVLDELPYQLADPMIITGNTTDHISKGDTNSVVVWTDWQTENGDSVIVPIRIDVDGAIEPYNSVNSVFDAYNPAYVADLLRDENIRYTRNNKSVEELLSNRRQVPAATRSVDASDTEGLLSNGREVPAATRTSDVNNTVSQESVRVKEYLANLRKPTAQETLGTIGEGLEEAASYYGSSIARMATWDKGYEMDFSEMWDNAKGGLLIGGIMNGLSMGAHTQSYKYASEIYKGTGGNYAAYLDSFMSAMHMENMNDVQRQALIDKYNSGEINVSRDAAINAGVEIQTNAEVVDAKKQAVESAENDAAVKVENANNKVTQAEQRLAGIDDPDPVKKGKKIAQASRELSAAKAAASQTASEGQKKVDTATADYKSEAAKAKRKNAANQQLVDEYHASKYYSDIERDTSNAPVGGSAADPTANTNADANTAQNGIDNIKNGVAQGDNRGFDARGNEIEYELNDEAKETLAQKYMTPEIQAHIAAMMEMPQTIDDNSPERQQYRIAKADEYYDKYQAANKNREAYIVIGPPAAGKSTIADPLVERTGSILIDSDIIKMGDKARGFEGIPEYGDGIGANAVHEESAQIADGIFVKAIAHGDNLVYPKVGGSAKSIRELAQQLKKHGYTTTLILNELPIEKALERNNNRYNETGRLVRPDYLLSVGNKPIRTYLELQGEGVFDGYERYSNDVNRGEAPFRVLEADKERPVVLRRGGSGRQTSDGDIIETGRAGSSGEGTKVAPQFSPALKDLGANTPSPVEMKQSKVYTNTYDKWLTEAEKAADKTENSWYARSKEVDTLTNAKNVVQGTIRRTGDLDDLMGMLSDKTAWNATDVDTAMLIGETLRAQAAETGEYSKLNDWKNVIRQNMTESGQAIQALAKWTRDSSVGAEAALDKAVADINRKNQKAIDKGKIAPVEVDPELLNELRSAQTRKERDAVMDRIAADIGSKVPTGVIDKINSWRYLSMLGNPRTILRNLIGNEIMSDVLWTSKDAVGAGLEKVMGVDQSQRTKALAFSDEYKANKAYAATTLDDARTALEDSSRYDTKSGIERAIDENRQIFKFKSVEKWREATDWALSKGDTVFLEKQYKRSFAQIMTARGYTPDTMTAKQRSECMSYAINEAKRSTFHDANSLADAMTKIENKSLATKILVGGTVPFKKTPLNVLARGVEFSPIGLIQGTGQMLTDVKAGKMDASTAIDKMSSGLVGSSLMALGYFLAKSGVISGGDNDEDKYYQSDLGKQEYALNLPGSSSMTIDWAAPASIPLFMGVALQELIDGGGSSDEAQTVGDHIDAFLGTLSSITDPLVEMSMLQGLQDTLEAVANARSDGNSLIGAALVTAGRGYASQFVPTIGGQIARTIDPVRRDTVGDPTSELGKDLDKVTNKMQAKIPGLASDLQPYVNIWGEQEINEHSWPVRLLEQAILPGYLDGVDMTPVDVELTRLYSVTQDRSVVPSNYPYRTLKDDKTKDRYILSADEYTAFKIDNGRAMYAAAEDAINSPQYQRMDDDEKASFVANAIDDAQRDILRKYKKKYLNQK